MEDFLGGERRLRGVDSRVKFAGGEEDGLRRSETAAVAGGGCSRSEARGAGDGALDGEGRRRVESVVKSVGGLGRVGRGGCNGGGGGSSTHGEG